MVGYPPRMRVPAFLVRQFYVTGSLRAHGDGFSIQATNPIGDGTLVGIGHVVVDGVTIEPSAVTAVRAGDPAILRAADVSVQAPVDFRRGDVVTFRIAGHPLAPGEHDFEVEIVERDLGTITLALRDTLAAQ